MNDTVNRQAYAVLRDMILSFELEPGQHVSDFTLSKQLGISRTPVREALASLVRDGLLIAGEKGRQVRPLDADDLQDLCCLREQFSTVQLQMRRYRFLTLVVDGRSQDTVAEHGRLIEALRLGDLPAAEQAMRDHLRVTVQRYSQVLQRMPAEEWIRLIRSLTKPQVREALLSGSH